MGNTTTVCTLSEEQGRTRRQELREGLVREIRAARELPDGIAFRFDESPATEQTLADFIRVEEGCCGFARYAVRRESAGLWLEIRGPDGTREMFAPMAHGVTLVRDRERGPLLVRWGWRSTLSAVALVVLCETPFLALGFAAVGLGSMGALLGTWLDGLAVILLVGGLCALGLAFRRRRNARGLA